MQEFLSKCKYYFKYAFFFSLFINILALTFPIYMLQVYDKVLSTNSMPTLVVITLAAIIALVLNSLLTWIRSRLLVRAGVQFERMLSGNVLYENLSQAGLPQGHPQPEGSLSDVSTLRNFLAGASIFPFFDAPWTPIFLLIMYLMHPLIGIVGIVGAICIFIMGMMTEKMTRQRLAAATNMNSRTTNFIGAAVRNADVARSMGMIGNITSRWNEQNHTVTMLQTEASKKANGLQAISRSFRQGLQISVYAVGAGLAIAGDCTPGIMIAASIIMGRALAPIDQAMGSYKMSLQAHGAYKRLKAMSEQEKPLKHMDLPAPTGEISVEGLFFAIQGRPVIRGMSFRMAAGQSLAIIGPSASGKSTLCKLLLNLWPPTSGKVRLDKADIASWDPEKLGVYLGYLPQDVELFSGSIAENIARLGEVDSEKVLRAAKMAGVHEMILKLPKGYDTLVGEMGAGLSAGQRQRIGLARALYGDPRIVILDEPNSNLDEEGDLRLAQCLGYLHQQKTSLFIVTHKMQILNIVDNIMILQDGQIVMCGPRAEVLAKLASMQKQREEDAARARARRDEIAAQQAALRNKEQEGGQNA